MAVIVMSALAFTLRASDQLALAVQENTNAITYKLELRQGQTARTIWSRRVPLINQKKPSDWCRLCTWVKNEHGLLALVENNVFFGSLLQFNASGDILAEIKVSYGFIRDGGSQVRLIPPDQVELPEINGSVTKMLIRNRELVREDGTAFERPAPLRVGYESDKSSPGNSQFTRAAAAATNATPNLSTSQVPLEPKLALEQKSDEPPISPQWIIITLIGVVCCFLRVLLKRRHRTTQGGLGADAN